MHGIAKSTWIIGVYIGVILGLYRDHRKENGSYYIIIGYILGLYRHSGKANENYYVGVI